MKTIELTIHRASIEFGCDHKSLAKWLVEAGHTLTRGKQFSLQEIHKAIAGDLEHERIRETRERANLLERERKQKDAELVSLEEVAQLVNPILLACRQRLNSLPSECASMVNPTDPSHAQTQLQAWVERNLPLIREALPPCPRKTQ